MPARKPAAPPSPPEEQTRDDWWSEFSIALQLLRPELGRKYVGAVALYQYADDRGPDAAVAAKMWTERKR